MGAGCGDLVESDLLEDQLLILAQIHVRYLDDALNLLRNSVQQIGFPLHHDGVA